MTNRCPRCAKLLHCGASDYCPQHRECNECEHNDTIHDVCDCSFTDLITHIEMLNTELLESAHTIALQKDMINRQQTWYTNDRIYKAGVKC